MTSLSQKPLRVAVALGMFVAIVGLGVPRIAGASPAALAAGPMVTVTPNSVTVGTTAIVHGAGFTPDSRALVFWQRPDKTTRAVFIATNGSGMFALRLGFAIRHGTGVEVVAARDLATNLQTTSVAVTVNPARIIVVRRLVASPNPVMKAGTTLIIGSGFIPRTLVLVKWTRPDGTHASMDVIANVAGAFAFRLFANPSHGCGVRTFVALDLATGTQSLSLSLAEIC
jgi:hypothetical protein